VAAIREGTRPDGSIIGPPLPFGQYRRVSDRDAAAVVAYLRSIPPVKNRVPKFAYGFPLPPVWGPPVGQVAAVDQAERVAYGGYLARPLGHCVECHTPMKEGRFDFEHSLGAGGFSIPVGGAASC
jgi:mono/diheme cytochrome c family protein